jgi:hypothetical protein
MRQVLNLFKPQVRKRTIVTIAVVSVLAHVIILLFFHGMVVYHQTLAEQVEFVAPPEVDRGAQEEKEHKVQVIHAQQRSSRPSFNLGTRPSVGSVALPEIKVTAPTTRTNLITSMNQVQMPQALTGSRVIQGGSDTVSRVNFLGISARGERIFFLLDVSGSMINDRRGGRPKYEELKAEVKDMIQNLSPRTLFNVAAFGGNVTLFRDEMVPATPDNKNAAARFIDPWLKEQGSRGSGVAYTPKTQGIPGQGGGTRVDLAVTAALELIADVIFVVSDGQPFIDRVLTGEELEEWTEAKEEKEAEWEEKFNKANERLARRDKPPMTREEFAEEEPMPGHPVPKWSDEDVIDHLELVAEKVYGELENLDPPKVHAVGYSTGPEEEEFLEDLAREFRGRFRRSRT